MKSFISLVSVGLSIFLVSDLYSQAFESGQGFGRLSLGVQLNNQYDILQGSKELKETGVPALDLKGLNGPKTTLDLGMGANVLYWLSPVLSTDLSYDYGQFSGASKDKILYANSVANTFGLGLNLSLKSARTVNYRWVPYLRASTSVGKYSATLRFTSDDVALNRLAPVTKGTTSLYGLGVGMRYHLSSRFHAYLQTELNQVSTDAWDGNDNGKRGDQFLRTSFGFRFALTKSKNRDQEPAWQGAVSAQDLNNIKSNVDSVSRVHDSNIKKASKTTEDLRKVMDRMQEDRQSEATDFLNRLKILEGQLEILKRQESNPVSLLDSTLGLKPINKTNESVISIYFATGSDEVNEDSKSILVNIVRVMNNSPELKVILTPFTDSRGLSWINTKLRSRRVNEVLEIFKGSNIDANRILFGEWPGTYLGKHELDRRVDVRFVR